MAQWPDVAPGASGGVCPAPGDLDREARLTCAQPGPAVARTKLKTLLLKSWVGWTLRGRRRTPRTPAPGGSEVGAPLQDAGRAASRMKCTTTRSGLGNVPGKLHHGDESRAEGRRRTLTPWCGRW